jgi:MFS transporter, DHA1 family, multidrug resistance protein
MLRNLPQGYFVLLVLTIFVNMGMGIVIPVLPSLVVETTNNVASLSWPFLTLVAFRIFSKPFAGHIIGKIGAKRVLQVMFLFFGASFILYTFADTLVMFSGIRAIEGIAEGIAAVVLLETALLLTKGKKNSGYLMGLFSSSFGIGYIFGPAVGSLLYVLFGKASMFYFGVTTSVLGVLLVYMLPVIDQKKINKMNKKGNFLKFMLYSNKYLICFIPQILRRVIFFSLMILIPLYAVDILDISAENVGWIFTASACITTVLMPVFGSFADKFNPKKIVSFSLLIMSACFFAIGFVNSVTLFVTFLIIETIAFSAMLPAGMKVFSDEAQNEEKRPAIMGLFGSYVEIVTLVLALLLPLLYTVNPSYTWGVLFIICFTSSILFLWKINNKTDLV